MDYLYLFELVFRLLFWSACAVICAVGAYWEIRALMPDLKRFLGRTFRQD